MFSAAVRWPSTWLRTMVRQAHHEREIFKVRGLSGTWGWLSWPGGPGGGFWGLGLCLSIVMVESRHRKWQGAIVSDLCGAGCLVGLLRSFDGVGDEGGLVRPPVRPSTGLRMNGLEASGWLGGLATILRLAQDERTGELAGLGIGVGQGF